MYRKETYGALKHYDFLLLDMLCLQAAFVLAYFLCGHDINPYNDQIYRNFALFVELGNLVVFFCDNTLKNVLKRGLYKEFTKVCAHTAYVFALCILCLFLIKSAQQYSRLIVVLTFAMYTVMTYLVRILWKLYLTRKMDGAGDRSLLLITDKENAEEVIASIRENNFGRYLLAGIVLLDGTGEETEISGVKVVSDVENVPMYVCQEWIDEVFLIPQSRSTYPKELVELLNETGVTLHVNLAKTRNMPGKVQVVEKLGKYTVLTTSMTQVTALEMFLKRLMDILGGLVGCIITGIIFIFVAPAIYIASPGPIFFSQVRVGKNGKRFKMYKFRSMYMDAEERKAELMAQNKISDAKMFKMDFDPRVIGNKILPDGTKKTGIGNLIRVTSLDEFPQFFNVLKGDMSIVGTRPPLIGEVNLYELHHRSRLAIKPGITGMWQVSGRSDITDFEEVVELDRQYIDQRNIGLDIKILLKTVLVVFKKDGSV